MYYAGEISRREAITKAILKNALAAFSDQNWVDLHSEKVGVTELMASQVSIDDLESRIARFAQGVRP